MTESKPIRWGLVLWCCITYWAVGGFLYLAGYGWRHGYTLNAAGWVTVASMCFRLNWKATDKLKASQHD